MPELIKEMLAIRAMRITIFIVIVSVFLKWFVVSLAGLIIIATFFIFIRLPIWFRKFALKTGKRRAVVDAILSMTGIGLCTFGSAGQLLLMSAPIVAIWYSAVIELYAIQLFEVKGNKPKKTGFWATIFGSNKP